MEKEGHYGTTLLLGAVAVVVLGFGSGLVATGVMLAFSSLPDKDHYIRESVLKHRGATHSLAFVLIVAFVTASTIAYPTHVGQQVAIDFGLLAETVVSPAEVWAFLAGTVTASLGGHIATDVLTTGGGYKVRPLWPVSSRTVALGLCNADNPVWNTALLASGVTAYLAAILHEFYYSLLPAIVGL